MRRLLSVTIAFMVACSSPEMTAVDQPAPVVVRAEMQRSQVDPGEAGLLVVTVDTTEGWSAELTSPEVEDLIIESVPMQASEAFGRRTATFEYHLIGDVGSFVIPPFEVVVSGEGDTVVTETPVMFFDIGESRFSSDLVGLASPPPKPESQWPKRMLLALIAIIAISIIWLFFRRLAHRRSLPTPLLPEDEEVMIAWRAICDDLDLSDHERALALSRIFRRYLERRFMFGASAMTTTEVLSNCGKADLSGDIKDVERLLSATDLIKFAGRRGGEALFADLGSDLVSFVDRNGNLEAAQKRESEAEAGDV